MEKILEKWSLVQNNTKYKSYKGTYIITDIVLEDMYRGYNLTLNKTEKRVFWQNEYEKLLTVITLNELTEKEFKNLKNFIKRKYSKKTKELSMIKLNLLLS